MNNVKFKGLSEIILGFWLFVSAFVGLGLAGSTVNDFLVGSICLSVSFFITGGRPWQSWITGILGLWLIVTAFISPLLQGVGIYLNDTIVGSILMAIGLMILIRLNKLAYHIKTGGRINYRNYGSE
jgi:hypothetical protein